MNHKLRCDNFIKLDDQARKQSTFFNFKIYGNFYLLDVKLEWK